MTSGKALERWLILCLVVSMLFSTGIVLATQKHVESGFFELGVLGPGMKASGYPYNVTITQLVSLWIFVANRMPEPERLRVAMRIGSSSLADDELAVVQVQEFELASNGNRTVLFAFTLSESGFTQPDLYRVQFLLYGSHENSSPVSSYSYTGLWLQIWLNVSE